MVLRRPLVELFAVEPDRIQVTWQSVPDAELTVQVADHKVTVATNSRPGGLILNGLTPDSSYELSIRGDRSTSFTHHFRTPGHPAGDELFRFATLNDVHLGETNFGYFKTIGDSSNHSEEPSVRCAHAAIGAFSAWGAQQLIIKGDLVHRGTKQQWSSAQQILDRVGIPTAMMLGNHEVSPSDRIDPIAAAAAMGHDLTPNVRCLDRPGIRVVLTNTTVTGSRSGRLARSHDQIIAAVADANGPCIVLLHHNLQRHRFPTFLPAGIPGPQADRLLSDLAATGTPCCISSGHTHRNRRSTRHGISLAEVGSPKDYPGVWAGYVVHEGGIRQVSYRITDPSCSEWLEQTHRAALGVWGLWSPGTVSDRCYTVNW